MRFDLQARGATAFGSVENLHRPGIEEYEAWLATVWKGDRRELRRGRYLQQQRDLQHAFEHSSFKTAVEERLMEWAADYQRRNGAVLFTRTQRTLSLDLKPWESFLSRTWRENVLKNSSWPDPPVGGWYAPDCWFERLWDVVRSRLVVRYLDGVQFLATNLVELADQLGVGARLKTHAQDDGYYAMHVVVRQPFEVQTLNFEEVEQRSSEIEIQLTTELQETIGGLTHGYFEHRREEQEDPDKKWQWDYSSEEFTPYYLGHLLHYLEGMIMQVREDVRATRG